MAGKNPYSFFWDDLSIPMPSLGDVTQDTENGRGFWRAASEPWERQGSSPGETPYVPGVQLGL